MMSPDEYMKKLNEMLDSHSIKFPSNQSELQDEIKKLTPCDEGLSYAKSHLVYGMDIASPKSKAVKIVHPKRRKDIDVMRVHRYEENKWWLAPHITISDGVDVAIIYT